MKDGRVQLKEAFNILRITHGCTSPIFKEELLPLLDQANVGN